MKFKLCSLIIATAISCPIASLAGEAAPTHCPSIQSIKQTSFISAEPDYWLGWIAISPVSNLDTERNWIVAMMIGSSDVKDAQTALKKANNFLPTLQANIGGPEKTAEGWWCFYSDGSSDPTDTIYTFTPSFQDLGGMLAKISVRHQRIQHR